MRTGLKILPREQIVDHFLGNIARKSLTGSKRVHRTESCSSDNRVAATN